ncbi:MAG: hypothetical protein HFH57_03580 [Lachnospiraceae bacterium]|nr:hypothetical protein [Lachnospiraceae bacterium]
MIKDGQERTKILKTLKTMEGYVLFSSIAIEITQTLYLKYEGKSQVSAHVFPSGDVRSQYDGISPEEFIPFYGTSGEINHN